MSLGKTLREPHLQHFFYLAGERRWVMLRLDSAGAKLVDGLGIEQVVQQLRSQGIELPTTHPELL